MSTTNTINLARAASPPAEISRELKTIAGLSLPMMAAQGGLMCMGVVDTLMIGRVSSLEMSAVALGNAVAGVIVVFGIGLAMVIEPLVSQAKGAGDLAPGRASMWQGLYLCVLVSLPLAALTALATQAFVPIGIPADIAQRAGAYMWMRIPGIVANCTYAVLRSYHSANGWPRPVLLAVALANVLNFALDYVLIFGHFGAPRLGAAGAGLATSIAWVFMTAVLALSIKQIEPGPAQPRPKMNLSEMSTIAKLGWPIGLQISAEVGIFALVSALIARFGTVPLAGHQIALTLASLDFMAAVGIANATTARVGFWVGAGDSAMARRSGLLGIALGGSFMAACGVVYAIFPHELTRLFAPDDPAASAMGASLLLIAAVFALADGVQAVAAGALRGAGATRWTLYANMIGYWVIAMPLALYLGHAREMGASGYWWALTAGLFVVATILTARFWVLSSRPMARVEQ